jgi:hypothetical protein
LKKLDLLKQIPNFLTEEDISFIFNNLDGIHLFRSEDETFNRWIYTVERDNSKFKFLFDKCDKIVYDLYNKKLQGHQLYFIKYNTGDYIKKHNDLWQTESSKGRLYSLVAQMTQELEYEGGETIIYLPDSTVKLSKTIGDAVIFPSSYIHELTEVTNGTRFSFVIMFKETLKSVVI